MGYATSDLSSGKEGAASINTNCWDGRWYLLAFDDDGGVIGSSTEAEGRIWVNPQAWAILSGVAPADRARMSMEAVQELMDTPVGVSKRVKALYVDGKPVAGNLIPILPAGREATIRVVVGA